jgi:hypothetical protein
MRVRKTTSVTLRLWGIAISAVGLLNIAQYLLAEFLYSMHNLGIAIGSSAMVFTGLVTLVAASCARNLEERLDRIDGRLPPDR